MKSPEALLGFENADLKDNAHCLKLCTFNFPHLLNWNNSLIIDIDDEALSDLTKYIPEIKDQKEELGIQWLNQQMKKQHFLSVDVQSPNTEPSITFGCLTQYLKPNSEKDTESFIVVFQFSKGAKVLQFQLKKKIGSDPPAYLLDKVIEKTRKSEHAPLLPLQLKLPIQFQLLRIGDVQRIRNEEQAVTEDSFWALCERYLSFENDNANQIQQGIGERHFISARKLSHRNYALEFKESITDYCEKLESTNIKTLVISQGKHKTMANLLTDHPDRLTRNQLRIEIDREATQLPLKAGKIEPSMTGRLAQNSRRKKALKKIQASETPMTFLRYLIEGIQPPIARRHTHTKVNNHLESTILGKQHFTHNQKRAIEIALQTPDIAIIQGPPGTGKTTIIQAIMAHFAEKANEEQSHNIHLHKRLIKPVLLSSYQHVAVEHAASKVKIFDLPLFKIGKKNDSQRETLTDAVQKWGHAQAQKIEKGLAKNELLSEVAAQEHLRLFHILESLQDEHAIYCSKQGDIFATVKNYLAG